MELDVENYHKISYIQESWGLELLKNKKWCGNEIVVDGGCGTGRITKALAQIMKTGKIYAVDLDKNMISAAREHLNGFSNVIFITSDLSTVRIPELVDVIFSNAVIHWILDHDMLFQHFWNLLKPSGELLIQCGGKGNLESSHMALENVRKNPAFRKYFQKWTEPWNFSSPQEISKILERIGFRNIETKLIKKTAIFDGMEEYTLFMKTVVMKPYLSYLPKNDKSTIDLFIKQFIIEIEKINPDQNKNYTVEYIRLNIKSKK